ncbi:MAG TPA: hypothetical protein VGY66_13480 [Gemmataceae bacterium]|jgi:DNA-directed RNA polymerase specialized sigma24 family protein|nr:hypothetical protein [Gemmataceae bacterium]
MRPQFPGAGQESHTGTAEETLVKGLQAGDAEAWECFSKTCEPAMLDAIRRALGRAGRSEDEVDRMAQFVRWRLLQRPQVLAAFDPQRGTLTAFLVAIARRTVHYHLRKPRRRKIRQRALRADVVQPPVWDGVDNVQLRECAAILSPRDRVFFWFMLDCQANENCRLTPCERQQWHRIFVQIRSHLAHQRAD